MQTKTIYLLFFGLLISLTAAAQPALDTYIKMGIDSNMALRQYNFDIRTAKLELDRAKTLFLPQVNLNAQYTVATGGRTQELPIGDLLNGVYKTLNQLTASNSFPQISNQTINFLPNDFHDTKAEVLYPVFNSDIRYNKQLKEEQIKEKQADKEIYRRELVKQIKLAYYQLLQAGRAVEIYKNAQTLVQENLRVAEKLVANNIATKEVPLKAKAQLSQVNISLTDAEQNRKNALAYFNFLLNRPFEAETLLEYAALDAIQPPLLSSVESTMNREELTKLRSGSQQLLISQKLNEGGQLPKLNAFYNAGFQGYGYKFDDKQFYQLAGLQLQWSLFKGYDNKIKIKETRVAMDALQNKQEEVQHQLNLQATTAFNSYRSAWESLQSNRDEMQSTAEVYRIVEKRWREGQALQIELIDARTQMTHAGIKYSLAQLTVLNRQAELERANASYLFK